MMQFAVWHEQCTRFRYASKWHWNTRGVVRFPGTHIDGSTEKKAKI